MLKVTLFEFLIRGIPESFFFVLAIYAFAKKRIQWVPFLISGVILILITYGVRFLPINFGVHIVFNLIALVLLSVFLNKIDILTSVKGAMFAVLSMVLCEALNVLVLQLIYGDKLTDIIGDSFRKAVAGTPGFVVYMVIVTTYYILSMRKVKIANKNGTINDQSSK